MRDDLRTIISLTLSRDGFRQILAGSFRRAEQLFEQALHLDQGNAYARLGLAEVTACRDELAAAMPKYREAVEQASPEERPQFLEAFVAALVRSGVKAREAGDDGRAERYFREALLITTNDTLRLACHEALSGIYSDSGKKEAAAWHFSQVLAALTPDHLALEDPPEPED